MIAPKTKQSLREMLRSDIKPVMPYMMPLGKADIIDIYRYSKLDKMTLVEKKFLLLEP